MDHSFRPRRELVASPTSTAKKRSLALSEIGSRDPSPRAASEGPRTEPNRRLAHLAGAIGVAGQVASAYWLLLYPLLVVPSPASFAFFAAWFVLVGLTVAWWRHHPVRSFFVPIVSVPAAVLAIGIGTTFLGWAP